MHGQPSLKALCTIETGSNLPSANSSWYPEHSCVSGVNALALITIFARQVKRLGCPWGRILHGLLESIAAAHATCEVTVKRNREPDRSPQPSCPFLLLASQASRIYKHLLKASVPSCSPLPGYPTLLPCTLHRIPARAEPCFNETCQSP